ncbi:MAG: MMPL family transporter [Gammaproteobacteria bacterium]
MPVYISNPRLFERLNTFLNYYKTAILAYSWWIIVLVILSCAVSLSYTIANLGFNTDTTDMLSKELPFHQDRIRFWKTFPQDVKSILIVVDAPSPEQAKNVVGHLGKRLKKEQSAIASVYMPGEGAFFDEQAFLYLDVNELAELGDKLSDTQPLLGQLARNNSLGGFLEIVAKAITAPGGTTGFDPKPVLKIISKAFADADRGKTKTVSWQKMLAGGNAAFNNSRRFLIVKPKLDYARIFPAERALHTIESFSRTIESEMEGVTVRMTGETALQHEELESVSKGSAISAVVSLLLVCVTLFLGLRSVKLMLATFLTLIAGLLLTAGFATFAVGHLNMISIAFAVLYIGLGVDYAIHLCLHYREFQNKGQANQDALMTAIKVVGPAIALCAITSAVGFYSFIPTAYSGVSELGIISGTSMFIGLGLTLTFLPAILNIMNATAVQKNETSERKAKQHFSHSRHSLRSHAFRWSVLGLAVGALFALPRVTFDFDPVHLRDANSESVKTYRDLVKDPNTSPLTLTVLESGREQMSSVAEKIRQLDTVEKVLTIEDFVPKNQGDKLALIEDMSLVLGPLPRPFPGIAEDSQQRAALNDFKTALEKAIKVHQGTGLEPELTALRDQFEHFDRANNTPDRRQNVLKIFEQNLLANIPATVTMLQNALNASPFGLSQLPADLFKRWLSPDGFFRVQVFPKHDITQLENLRGFVEDVQRIAPHATDLPVIYLEAGKEVVKAFQQALATALIAIFLVLLAVLRSVRDTVFVLIPLILASLLTSATSVWIGLPFNFANIIAVPLLFGLGVDSGIHIMHSMRNRSFRKRGLRRDATSRGVFFSALTTIFSFSSLAFSAHSGTASMGILLAIGIFFMLFCTLVVLPAFVGHIYATDQSKIV